MRSGNDMFQMQAKRVSNMKMGKRQLGYLIIYFIVATVSLIIVHELVHIITAIICGVPVSDLKVGFYGINPSVTIPAWFTGTQRTVLYYAGGIVSGLLLLAIYLFYWVKKYRHNPNPLTWLMSMVTIELASWQFASGYLEGKYHSAYIIGSLTVLSPANLFISLFMIFSLFPHLALNPLSKIRKTAK